MTKIITLHAVETYSDIETRKNAMQIIVLGMHRSGTSMVARLLNLMGIYFGPEGSSTGQSKENPKGFWERRDVRGLNDFVLHSNGSDWNRVLNFDPEDVPENIVAEFTKRASKLVLEMDAHRPWLLKEPRLSLLLTLWCKVLEVPVCVQILRNPVEVAASLFTRNGIPIAAGMALWEKYVRFGLAASSKLPRIRVTHHELMQDPITATKDIFSQLVALGISGIHMPSDREIREFVRQDLHREKASRQDLLPYSTAPQVELFEQLTAANTAAMEVGTALTQVAERDLSLYESSLTSSNQKPGETSLARSEPALQQRVALLEQELKLRGEMADRLDQERERERQDALIIKDQLKYAQELASKVSSELKQRSELIDKLRSDLAVGSEMMQESKDDAERRILERFLEIKKLTKMLMEKEEELERLHIATTRLSVQLHQEKALRVSEVGNLNKKLKVLTERYEQRLGEIINSRAWKITAPLRSLNRLAKSGVLHRIKRVRQLRALQNSGLFDASWYLRQYKDVETSRIDPFTHYLDHGAAEGRNPGPAFDTKFYLASNPDVAASGMNPVLHFVFHGKSEGRKPMNADRRMD